MPALSKERIATLIAPFLPNTEVAASLYSQLSLYLDVLLRWNGRTNLTAIREPEEIVVRHFGESLFAGVHVSVAKPANLLDFGSGAGFPGLPIQLLYPSLAVTLAESQGKKAAFLREAVRVLGLKTEVWPRRVDAMPAERMFGVVAMRAVDNMPEAVGEARLRVAPGGQLAILGGEALVRQYPEAEVLPLPESSHRFLILDSR